jgi:hypothetical protein
MHVKLNESYIDYKGMMVTIRAFIPASHPAYKEGYRYSTSVYIDRGGWYGNKGEISAYLEAQVIPDGTKTSAFAERKVASKDPNVRIVLQSNHTYKTNSGDIVLVKRNKDPVCCFSVMLRNGQVPPIPEYYDEHGYQFLAYTVDGKHYPLVPDEIVEDITDQATEMVENSDKKDLPTDLILQHGRIYLAKNGDVVTVARRDPDYQMFKFTAVQCNGDALSNGLTYTETGRAGHFRNDLDRPGEDQTLSDLVEDITAEITEMQSMFERDGSSSVLSAHGHVYKTRKGDFVVLEEAGIKEYPFIVALRNDHRPSDPEYYTVDGRRAGILDEKTMRDDDLVHDITAQFKAMVAQEKKEEVVEHQSDHQETLSYHIQKLKEIAQKDGLQVEVTIF